MQTWTCYDFLIEVLQFLHLPRASRQIKAYQCNFDSSRLIITTRKVYLVWMCLIFKSGDNFSHIWKKHFDIFSLIYSGQNAILNILKYEVYVFAFNTKFNLTVRISKTAAPAIS